MPPPDDENDPEKPAGRVRHDASGRAIWEWAAESGRHAIDSTSRLLKRLDLPGLMLADDAQKKQEEEEQAAAEALKAAGKPVVPTFGGTREADPAGNSKHSFNPYDTRATKRSAPKPARKTAAKPAAPVKRPGLFARLFGGK